MKTKITLLLILTTIIVMSSEIANAQKVKGDGNVIKQSRSLAPFNEININGVVNVNLTQGSTESAEVEADANLINYVETKVIDGVLQIGIKEDVQIKNSTKMEVYVTLKSVDKITNSGVGNVSTGGTLKLADLKIECQSVGNFKLDLDCKDFEADVNSVGSLQLTGRASNVKISNNSVGNVKAFDFKADVLKIENNGVGNAQDYSDKEIYIDLNGIGNVSYKGDAIVKALNVNGMGKVNKQ